MGFNNSNGSFSRYNNNGSYQQAKKVSPVIQSDQKSSNSYGQLKDGLSSYGAGLDCVHKMKMTAVFPESEVEDANIAKQLDFTDGLSDESDCLWLSSDCKPSSLLSSNDFQDVWEFDCLDSSLHDQFSSMLSLSGTCGLFLDKDCGVSMFEGSRIRPTVEASSVLDRPSEGTDQKHLQEKVVIWLCNTDGSEIIDSSLGCAENGYSSYESSLFEESSVFESSSTSLSTYDDSPFHVKGYDITDMWVSLLDLEEEDSELVQDREQGFDAFGSDFPSPSFNAKENFLTRCSISSSIHSFGKTEEAKSSSEDYSADEPLFWPYDRNSYWHPDLDQNFLCLSPCQDERSVGVQGINGLKPGGLKLHHNSKPPVGSKNLQGCRRRIMFTSPPKSAITDFRTRSLNNNALQKINATPSMLSRSTQAPSEQHTCNSVKRRSLQLNARIPKHRGNPELLSKHLLELEARDIHDLVVKGVSIEKLVGLNEFDGHEGIMEPDEDQFNLHGSPYEKAISWTETEKYVGLNEFDGHEGMNMELDDNQFTLCGSPCKKALSWIDVNEFVTHEGINVEFNDDQFTLHGLSNKKAFSLRKIERSIDNSDQNGYGHVSLDSFHGNLIMDDYCKANDKDHDNVINVQSNEPNSHSLMFSEKEGASVIVPLEIIPHNIYL